VLLGRRFRFLNVIKIYEQRNLSKSHEFVPVSRIPDKDPDSYLSEKVKNEINFS